MLRVIVYMHSEKQPNVFERIGLFLPFLKFNSL